MPEYLVLLLVQITIFSSVTALLLLAVKFFFRRRIPPELSLFLWLILLVRMMLPVLPESALSIYNLIHSYCTIIKSCCCIFENKIRKI